MPRIKKGKTDDRAIIAYAERMDKRKYGVFEATAYLNAVRVYGGLKFCISPKEWKSYYGK